MRRCLVLLVLTVLSVCACKSVSSYMHDGEVVAKVGKHKLYAAELEEFIPGGVSTEDSTRLALQYINNWASDRLFMDMAESELTKGEKDLSREIEAYRSSLLKYRYEQKYINQRLDTAVARQQIEQYYEAHAENFRLVRPVVKARFVRLSKDSPNLSAVRRNLSAQEDDDMVVSDSLTYASALRYTDYGQRWIDIAVLAREFEIDYLSLQSALKNGLVELPDGKGNIGIAYVSEMIKAGEPGPVEYYEDQIRETILSTRKQTLLSGLERELIEKARKQDNFVIY